MSHIAPTPPLPGPAHSSAASPDSPTTPPAFFVMEKTMAWWLDERQAAANGVGIAEFWCGRGLWVEWFIVLTMVCGGLCSNLVVS